MENGTKLPGEALALLRTGLSGRAAAFECPAELGAVLRAELAQSGCTVGFVCTDDGVYERMNVLSYLRFFADLAGARAKVCEVLEAMALSEDAKMPMRSLASPERKRLGIAREMLREPALYFIEEPLAGQTPGHCKRILAWMEAQAAAGHGVLATTVSTRTAYLLPGERYHLDEQCLEPLDTAESEAPAAPGEAAIEKIPAKAGETLLLFNPAEIDYAESADGKTSLTVKGEGYLCALTLDELTARLERYGFFRCHRSYLVNMQKVQEIIRWTRNSYSLRLENGPDTGVPLSKGRIDTIRQQYHF